MDFELERSLEPSDHELVNAACCGNKDAFGSLYKRYWRLAVGVALSVCADRQLSEDAAQEAFAVVAKRLHTLRDRERFPQWLSTICRRTANQMRVRQPPFVALQIDPPTSTVDDIAERKATLLCAIERLEADTREILVLRYFSQLSHDEIAKSLSLTPAAVHGRLQRARRKL